MQHTILAQARHKRARVLGLAVGHTLDSNLIQEIDRELGSVRVQLRGTVVVEPELAHHCQLTRVSGRFLTASYIDDTSDLALKTELLLLQQSSLAHAPHGGPDVDRIVRVVLHDESIQSKQMAVAVSAIVDVHLLALGAYCIRLELQGIGLTVVRVCDLHSMNDESARKE